MISPLERRRFSRFIVPLEVRYQAHHPESGDLHQGQGVIRDLSLTGGFFHLDHTPAFQPGQIVSLTIAAPLPVHNSNHISHFAAQGEVIRLEPPDEANPSFGVAVSFLQNLSFAAP
jgi:hypothetical protein